MFAEVASAAAIYEGDRDPAQYAAHVMVLADDWKYVWNRFEVDELYNLAADPAEMATGPHRHPARSAWLRCGG